MNETLKIILIVGSYILTYAAGWIVTAWIIKLRVDIEARRIIRKKKDPPKEYPLKIYPVENRHVDFMHQICRDLYKHLPTKPVISFSSKKQGYGIELNRYEIMIDQAPTGVFITLIDIDFLLQNRKDYKRFMLATARMVDAKIGEWRRNGIAY